MATIKQTWLDRAHRWYVDNWLWDEWGYSDSWERRLPYMILYYSVAGSAVLNETAASLSFAVREKVGLCLRIGGGLSRPR